MSGEHNGAVNPLPPVVWALALPVIAMEVVLWLGQNGIVGGAEGIGWRLEAFERFAFSPGMFEWMWENRRWPLGDAARVVTYPFVHLGFGHAVFVVMFLLALGKMVGEVFRPWAVLAVFFGGAVAGALAYTGFGGGPQALIGGYPAVFGLIGAFTYLLWLRLGATGGNRLRAFGLIAALVAIRVSFGLMLGGNDWIADIAGFGAGFALSFVVSPGGAARMLALLRQR